MFFIFYQSDGGLKLNNVDVPARFFFFVQVDGIFLRKCPTRYVVSSFMQQVDGSFRDH